MNKEVISILILIIILLEEVLRMLEFIQNNPVLCIVIAVIIVALIVYAYKYRQDILKKAALYAVAKAEEAWGSKTGQIKFSEVYTSLKKKYPFMTFFISEKQLSQIIEDALEYLKTLLKNGAELEHK